jgi:threonine dehydratase
MITAREISDVYEIIAKDLYRTPLIYSPELSRISGASVYLKMEHLQKTGSFKLRGILSKISTLASKDFEKTFVAASTGNHAAAFAYASEKFDFEGVLFLPEGTKEAKLKALDQYSVRRIFHGKSSMETEAKATSYSREIGGVLVHPYNDPDIIKGQGTIGVEILEDLPGVDAVLAPIGGGGLISGLCSFFNESQTDVIGCQPVNAQEMYDSVKKNEIVPPSSLSTISDATAGGIEENAISFDICKEQLWGFELIEEEEIKKALAFIIKYHQTIIEPASALPVAALLGSNKYKGKKVALVLTGRKVDIKILNDIISTYGDYY